MSHVLLSRDVRLAWNSDIELDVSTCSLELNTYPLATGCAGNVEYEGQAGPHALSHSRAERHNSDIRPEYGSGVGCSRLGYREGIRNIHCLDPPRTWLLKMEAAARMECSAEHMVIEIDADWAGAGAFQGRVAHGGGNNDVELA